MPYARTAAVLVLSLVPVLSTAQDFTRTREEARRMADPAGSAATWRNILGEREEFTAEEGLVVIGAAMGHERTTARRFAHYLHRKFGLTLVLMSKVSRMTIPAFDGLIVNDRDGVVANFSMKQTQNKFNFRDSHSKVRDYQQLGPWVDNLLWQPRQRDSVLAFGSRDELNAFDRRTHLIRDLARVFGVGTPRKTWMLVEFTSGRTIPRAEIEHLARRDQAWNEHITRMFIIDDHQIFDVKPVRTRPGELRGCERFLRPEAELAYAGA